MTADEIRSIDVSQESEAVRSAFALSMLQEVGAQLAELNERLAGAGMVQLKTIAEISKLATCLHESGSVVPYLYRDIRPVDYWRADPRRCDHGDGRAWGHTRAVARWRSALFAVW